MTTSLLSLSEFKKIMQSRIYLDNNATTFLDPRVLKTVVRHLNHTLANPSSTHSYGIEARSLLTHCRRTIADHLSIKPTELIFTSCGTEGINLVMRGLLDKQKGGHLITSSAEHACVFTVAKYYEACGGMTTFLNPGLFGAVTPEEVAKAIRSDTRLIVLMAVNNETGVKTDVEAIARIARDAHIPFLVDGVAALGKERLIIPDGVSAMSFSGHKIHAPKGVGAVYVRGTMKLIPHMMGGEQEFGKRGGTENLPGIAGMAEAVRILDSELPSAAIRMKELRDRLEAKLTNCLSGVAVNGQGPRISNTSNLSFEGVEGEVLLARLDMEGVAVSHGSACSSGALEPSRVLLNMGIPRDQARKSIRISLSRFTTQEEIDNAVEVICSVVADLRR